ncbi:hypothetical protein D777_01781 [Marinobacter nitratireducens]|uniref:Uncharacterized protein n=1 Tax=Marinobacter nitratireducens TaxID=1137280 RepID=A0A072N2H9_9GAMM|nr:hypothetical protein [Marinobacter nitratireducens]KEF31432.1 hypothetical protein D777_01781 [Marinobacter nitratireducens]
MTTRKRALIAAGILASTLAATSPFAFAHERNGDHSRGKHDIEQMCEQFREGNGPFNREQRRAEMQERRAAMADRLQLTDEQREIWQEIQQEQFEKHQKRMDKYRGKMEKRCDRVLDNNEEK